MKKSIAVLTLAVSGFVLTGISATSTIGAQETKSVKSGVYTEAQAARGKELHATNCAACHGEDLAGSGPMPALAGEEFLANWKTLGDLFEKTHSSMPANAPGSLTEKETSDILAYMLSASKFPAGATELESTQDALAKVTIEKP